MLVALHVNVVGWRFLKALIDPRQIVFDDPNYPLVGTADLNEFCVLVICSRFAETEQK